MGKAAPIINPKFPFNFNTPEGSRIISRLFHDGGMDRRNLEPFYANIDKGLRDRFVSDVRKLIPRLNPISENHNGKEIIFPKILGLILVSLGLVPGKRPINNPKFPKFIFNYSKDLIFEFLSQAIADDGWVCVPRKGFGYIYFAFTIDLTRFSERFRQRIIDGKIKSYLPNVLLGDMNLFEKVDCKVEGPYIKKKYSYVNDNDEELRYTQEWRIQIRDFRSLNILRKNLCIPLEYKQRRLEEISRKERKCTILRFDILKIIKTLRKVRRYEIVGYSGYKIRRVDYNLKEFKKLGLVGVECFGKNNCFVRYCLTDKGLKEAEIYE